MFSAIPFFGKRPKPTDDGPSPDAPAASIARDAGAHADAAASTSSQVNGVAARPSARALGKRKEVAVEPSDRRTRRMSAASSNVSATPNLRKRKHDGQTDADDDATAPPSVASTVPFAAPVVDGAEGQGKEPSPKKKLEKRVTRSSLAMGGPGLPGTGALQGRKRSDSSDSENGWVPPPPLLPPSTVIRLTTKPPSPTSTRFFDLEDNDEAVIAHLGTSLAPKPSENPSPAGGDVQSLPTFRLLNETELIPPGRTRGAPSTPSLSSSSHPLDSDAHFQRLHRFPEVLEKRSKRREKERLVHARFQLRATLEALRNTSDGKTVRALVGQRWREEAQSGMNRGKEADGGTELERIERTRRVMMKEIEETLKRYDALLEPRRDTSMHRADSVTSLSDRAGSPSASLRGVSPAPLPHPYSYPQPDQSSSAAVRRAPITYGRPRPSARQVGPSKGIVRTGSGLALKILFRGPGGKFVKSPEKNKRARVGRPPRREQVMITRARRDDEVDEEEYDEEIDDEEGADADVSMESVEVRRPGRPRKEVLSTRIRTQDSFFDSPSLRASIASSFVSPSPSSINNASLRRRISTRVQHAFGARVPDFPSSDVVRDFDPLKADEAAWGAEAVKSEFGEGSAFRLEEREVLERQAEARGEGKSMRKLLEERRGRV